MKIVCRYRKTIPRNSVYKLEKLISNCSVTNSEISSMHEAATIFATPEAHSDDQIVTTFGLPKVHPKLLEPNANQEGIHLTPSRLMAVTNTLAECISWNPSVRKILMAKDLSQIRCYNCNKIGHKAKYCRNRKKSNCTSNKFRHNFYKHPKSPSSGPNISCYK